MAKCTDPDIGQLIHAYELTLLSDEERELFELHYMSCEYCYKKIQDFEQEADIMKPNEKIKKIVSEALRERENPSASFFRRIWNYLWPKGPLVFRPALIYSLALLLAFIGYYGSEMKREEGVASVQICELHPIRSEKRNVFKKSLKKDGILLFYFEHAESGESYEVVVEHEEGWVAFDEKRFDLFDDYGSGQLLWPQEKMKTGQYQIAITDPRKEPPDNRKVYGFRIEN